MIVKEGETLRDIAKQYLQDSDLWEEILRFNRIEDGRARCRTGNHADHPVDANYPGQRASRCHPDRDSTGDQGRR